MTQSGCFVSQTCRDVTEAERFFDLCALINLLFSFLWYILQLAVASFFLTCALLASVCCKLDVEKCCVAVATKMKGGREKMLENTIEGCMGGGVQSSCVSVFLFFFTF